MRFFCCTAASEIVPRTDGGDAADVSKNKKHQRECPALGRTITSAECGAGRGSAYACPAECPHFPFTPANYDQHGEVEQRLIRKTYERAARTMTDAERERLLRVLDQSEGSGEEVLVNHARFVRLCHGERDAEGRTFNERWLADKTGGLSNDERVLLAAMNRMQPVLLEVHRILDEQTIEGVDLLDGRALRIVDRANAGRVDRYAVLLSWCYPMAHYARASGAAMLVQEVDGRTPEEVLREVIRHLGGPADPAGERAWLAEHFSRTCAALEAVQLARWQATMAALDGRYTKTDYRVVNGTRLATLLAKRRDLEDEDLAEEERAQGYDVGYVCFENPPQTEAGQLALPLPTEPQVLAGMTVLGRVLLGRERVRIEAMTQARHQALRARFERLAAGHIEFLGERTDDLATQSLAGQAPAFDPALVPPRLMENLQRISLSSQRLPGSTGGSAASLLEAFRQQYAGFPDESIPALNGHTPRAAAADPALRPLLVNLMKTHIQGCDRQRREHGLDLDLNPLLAELGLHEMISAPPPLGTADEELGEVSAADWDDQPGPHAGMPPLTERSLSARLRATHERYPTMEQAADAIHDAFPELLDFAWDVTQATLSEPGWPFLELLIVRTCHVLKPPAGPLPDLDFTVLGRGVASGFANVAKLVEHPARQRQSAIDRWLNASPQPLVMQDLAGTLFTGIEKLPRQDRPSSEELLVILAFLKSLVAEFSRALA